jgi:hypothetical protein
MIRFRYLLETDDLSMKAAGTTPSAFSVSIFLSVTFNKVLGLQEIEKMVKRFYGKLDQTEIDQNLLLANFYAKRDATNFIEHMEAFVDEKFDVKVKKNFKNH